MKEVFLLWHSHDLGDSKIDDKLIGIYSSQSAAEAAKKRSMLLKGFREAFEGFAIDRYELDRDHWNEGYISTQDPPSRSA